MSVANALTLDHSVFLIDGSNHSYHRALHCLGVFRTSNDEIRALMKAHEWDLEPNSKITYH